jgi:hypothetical protein
MSLRAAGLTVPILTWLNPSGVDAEAAAIGRIDIAVGSLMDAPRDHSVNTRHNDPITPSARHGVSDP